MRAKKKNEAKPVDCCIMRTVEDVAFDQGFHQWMGAAIEYEWYKRKKKPIPKRVEAAMKRGSHWVANLSDADYSRLIH